MNSPPIIVAGEFMGKPEHRQEIIDLAASMFEPSRAEPGCIRYEFYEDPNSPSKFLFFEEWRSQADLDKHFETPHFKRFSERFFDLISGDLTVKAFDISQTRKLM